MRFVWGLLVLLILVCPVPGFWFNRTNVPDFPERRQPARGSTARSEKPDAEPWTSLQIATVIVQLTACAVMIGSQGWVRRVDAKHHKDLKKEKDRVAQLEAELQALSGGQVQTTGGMTGGGDRMLSTPLVGGDDDNAAAGDTNLQAGLRGRSAPLVRSDLNVPIPDHAPPSSVTIPDPVASPTVDSAPPPSNSRAGWFF